MVPLVKLTAKHPFPSTAKTTRRVCKSGQKKEWEWGLPERVASQPGVGGLGSPPSIPRAGEARAVPGLPGPGRDLGQDDIMAGAGVGHRARTQPGQGWVSMGPLGAALEACGSEGSSGPKGASLPMKGRPGRGPGWRQQPQAAPGPRSLLTQPARGDPWCSRKARKLRSRHPCLSPCLPPGTTEGTRRGFPRRRGLVQKD